MEKSVFKEKILPFLNKNYGFFAIPVFVFLVFGIAEACFGIWPFGYTCMSSYDHLAQVSPLLEHYFAVFDGTDGLFHTFFVGGGMDLFGSLAYCTISPFTFVFLLGGKGNVINMISIVLPLKVSCAAVVALLFLKRYFKDIPYYISVVMAVLYAFGGYLYVANTYVNWVDLMIYMPVLVSGFIRFIKTDRLTMFVVGLVLNIYTCFSISCFSFFSLFPILVLYVIICVNKEERAHKLTRLCLGFVLGIAISLPLLIPAFYAFKVSSRNTGIFSEIFKTYTKEDIEKGKLVQHLYEKLTYFLCNSAFVFLGAVYFVRSEKGDKFAFFSIFAFLILIVPCLVEESMSLLNMGSTYSYTYRFGFLMDMFGLYISAKSVSSILRLDDASCKDSKKATGDVTENERQVVVSEVKSKNPFSDFSAGKKTFIALLTVSILVTLGGIFTFLFFRFILDGDYKNDKLVEKIAEWFSLSSDNMPFDGFFASFAHSCGGLEAVIVLFLAATIIFVVATLFVKFKFVKFKEVASLLCVLSLSQCVFYGFATVKGNRQGGSKENYDQYSSMIEQIKENYGDEYSRLKSHDYYISGDSPITLRNYTYSIFSSVTDAENFRIKEDFGYSGGTNSIRSNGGRTFADAFMSYRFEVYDFYCRESKSNHSACMPFAENKSSLKRTDIYAWSKPVLDVRKKEAGNNGKNTSLYSVKPDYKGVFKEVIPYRDIVFSVRREDGGLTFSVNGTEVYKTRKLSSEPDNVKVVLNRVTDATASEFTLDGLTQASLTTSKGCKKKGDSYTFSYGSDNMTGYLTYSNAADFKTSEVKISYEGVRDSNAFIGLRVYLKNGEQYWIQANTPRYTVYENTLALPSCAVVDGDNIVYDEDDNKYKKEIAVYEFLSGKEFKSSSVSESNIKSLKKKLEDREVRYELRRNEIVLPTITAEKGQSLFINYFNIKGYEVKVNGVKREMKTNPTGLMIIPLDEGENTVTIKYRSPYYKYILAGLVVGAVIVALYLLLTRKFSGFVAKCEKVVAIAAVVLAAALILFFFVFPTGLFLKKFFFDYVKIIF